jgi:hypothetical protein
MTQIKGFNEGITCKAMSRIERMNKDWETHKEQASGMSLSPQRLKRQGKKYCQGPLRAELLTRRCSRQLYQGKVWSLLK